MSHRFGEKLRYFQHDPSGPHVVAPVIDHVTVSGSAPGQLTATAYDVHGAAVANVSTLWSSDHPEYATVSASGFVAAGVSHGTAHITATVDGRGYMTAVTT